MKNPFSSNFESFEGPMSPLVESLHRKEFKQLKHLATGDEGVLISLRAPRAGYGKTMLLSRLREELRGASVMVPVELSADYRIDEKEILGRILDQLTVPLPGKRELTGLDFSVRRILASALIPLVESGEVPSPNRTESLRSLRERPEEVFDFQKESAAVAQWVKAQFAALSPRLVSVLGQSCGGVSGDLSLWFSVLSRYAMTSVGKGRRNHELLNTVFGEESQPQTGTGSHGALISFLKLITTTENVVLVMDEMDGLFGDSEAALRVANSLVALRQAAPRLKVIFSVNDDVWESTFARRIPLGMQDRFEDSVIRLKAIDEGSMVALLKTRDPDGAEDLRQKIQLDRGDLYPRAVLRAARDVWGTPELAMDPVPAVSETPDVSVLQAKDIGFAEVPAKKMVETDLTEAGKPDVPFASPVLKIKYPPKPVRRAAIPRKYLVQRIRQESDSVRVPPAPPAPPAPLVNTAIESPFRIADPSREAEVANQARATPPPLAIDGGDGDSIDDLLRKFRERHDAKDTH